MHQWAVTVERLGGRIGEDLKSGSGPPVVLELLVAISEAMAVEERGSVASAELLGRIGSLGEQAGPFLVRGGAS
ncbi:MAG: hypothetical protein HW416_1617 [Chloroflexi bacterium]|nr:hypothetical protein [Chloroflexota bacterium]